MIAHDETFPCVLAGIGIGVLALTLGGDAARFRRHCDGTDDHVAAVDWRVATIASEHDLATSQALQSVLYGLQRGNGDRRALA